MNVQVSQTQSALQAQGKQLRQTVPFDNLATYHKVDRNPLTYMKHVSQLLVPDLVPLREQRMAANIFAFYRGTDELMDNDLDSQAATKIQAVICGDAHIANFGFYASPERQLLFDLNDFDESTVGSWEGDLRRFLVSILLEGQVHGFKEKKVLKAVKDACANYRAGLIAMMNQSTLDRFYPANDVRSVVDKLPLKADGKQLLHHIVDKATKQTSEEVVRKFTTLDRNGNLVFQENPPRSVRVDETTQQQLTQGLQDYRKTVRTDVALLLSQYHITDIERHSVGVGSFGTLCYLVLLTATDGSHLVLQLKEALPTWKQSGQTTQKLTAASEYSQGKRIVDCQKILQSAWDPFLGYFKAGNKSFYVRQFRDMKESVKLQDLTWDEYKAYTGVCAWILATAHAQSPTAAMIRGYVGHSNKFDEAMVAWSKSYTKQVQQDYRTWLKAMPKSVQQCAPKQVIDELGANH
ncbi:DUF2252 domain-containing protein [Levilactobacillus bambusae]|uniref:DUF2252 domain-containing protein n=2 Tax=Levilactobacillus bambusae TaxID=2024736 RepID=A0A2V1MXB2_9LACO|nr:DUF2252 domain-containing protein [Levilactobacillus bambusae]